MTKVRTVGTGTAGPGAPNNLRDMLNHKMGPSIFNGLDKEMAKYAAVITQGARMRWLIMIISAMSLLSCSYKDDPRTKMFVCVDAAQQEKFKRAIREVLSEQGFSVSTAAFGSESGRNFAVEGTRRFMRVWVQNVLQDTEFPNSEDMIGIPFRQDLFVVSVISWFPLRKEWVVSTFQRTRSELSRRGYHTVHKPDECIEVAAPSSH